MKVQIAGLTKLAPYVCNQLANHGLMINSQTAINRNFLFNGPVEIFSNCTLTRVQMDAYSYINNDATIRTTKIGRYCSIGNHVDIGMPFHNYKYATSSTAIFTGCHFERYVGKLPDVFPYAIEHKGSCSAEPTIGNDVWVGAHVKIPASVNIGHGAVIGTNAVITKDVPPYAIIQTSTNNQKLKPNELKYRFKDEVIADLLEINWWDYDLLKMLAAGVKVPYTKIEDFIKFFKNEDLSAFPLIPDDWRLLTILSENKIKLIPGQKDMFMDFTHIDLPDEP